MMQRPDLAGDFITIRDTDRETIVSFDDRGTGRVCGSCTLCCKLVPVPTIKKAAGQRCPHQRVGKGCLVYANRPYACKTWSCRWMADERTAGMPRPDRCHYVIDMSYDYVTLRNAEGKSWQRGVVQVWLDPAFPEARHAPELRDYMDRMAREQGCATILRFDSARAVTVFPPAISDDRQWHEITDGTIEARTPEEHAILNGWDNARIEFVP